MSILIDTGVFYAFYNKKDVHHLDSICLLVHILEGRYGRPYTVDPVVSETYTLLRYRLSYETAMAFLEALKKSRVTIIFLDDEDYRGVIRVLKEYPDRKLSFTDAFLIHVSVSYGIENVVSYDERPFSGIVARIFGRDYANTLSRDEFNRIMNLVSSFKAL